VCWALYILFGQKAGADNGVTTAALGVMIAALFVAPIGIVHAGTALLTPSLIPIAIGVAILSTALPYTLEMVALTRMPARTFGTLMSIEPALAHCRAAVPAGVPHAVTMDGDPVHYSGFRRGNHDHGQHRQARCCGRLIQDLTKVWHLAFI
jgi:hypothetical protein